MSTGEFLLREPDWQDWLVVDEDGRPLPFARYPASRTMSTRRAEGVDAEEQRDFLPCLGVRTGQGFLFSRGLRPGEFAQRVPAQQDIA